MSIYGLALIVATLIIVAFVAGISWHEYKTQHPNKDALTYNYGRENGLLPSGMTYKEYIALKNEVGEDAVISAAWKEKNLRKMNIIPRERK